MPAHLACLLCELEGWVCMWSAMQVAGSKSILVLKILFWVGWCLRHLVPAATEAPCSTLGVHARLLRQKSAGLFLLLLTLPRAPCCASQQAVLVKLPAQQMRV